MGKILKIDFCCQIIHDKYSPIGHRVTYHETKRNHAFITALHSK